MPSSSLESATSVNQAPFDAIEGLAITPASHPLATLSSFPMTATLCKASPTRHHSLNKTTPTTAGHSHRHSHGCSHRKLLGMASSMTGSTTKAMPITTKTTDIVLGQSAQPNLNDTYFVSGERPLQPRRFLGPIILAFIVSLFWV
jgi:hypothetical protein